MLGLPFNQSTLQVYKTGGNFQRPTNFAPVNNAGTTGWLEFHGDGLVEAGGGFNYTFPTFTDNWIVRANGEIGVSLIPKGASIGAPPAGATPEQYASVVQSRANGWTIAGTVLGQVCAQIPSVASACATGAAGISNNGIAGCASFSLPGTKTLQTIAIAFAKGINFIARTGEQAGLAVAKVFTDLGLEAQAAAARTGQFFNDAASTLVDKTTQVANDFGNGVTDAGSAALHYMHIPGFAADGTRARPAAVAATVPVAQAAAGDVINTNIVIPDVNFAVGAAYKWSDKSTHVLTACSHTDLLQALLSRDRARASRASGARGVPSTQVFVRGSGRAPRLFVIKGVTSAPDVIVMGPDRRAIRTLGRGFVKPGWIVYKDLAAKTTYVDAVGAPAGRWSFVTAPHTSRIASIQTAAGVSIPSVGAGFKSAKGRRFVIAYRIAGLARGERVTLAETDGSGLTVTFATLRGTRGSVSYVPSPKLPSSKRLILAIIKRGATQISAQPVTGIDLAKLAKKKAKPKGKHRKGK
jgi:hypothetical protein